MTMGNASSIEMTSLDIRYQHRICNNFR